MKCVAVWRNRPACQVQELPVVDNRTFHPDISDEPVHGMVCHGPLLVVEGLCIMMANAFNDMSSRVSQISELYSFSQRSGLMSLMLRKGSLLSLLLAYDENLYHHIMLFLSCIQATISCLVTNTSSFLDFSSFLTTVHNTLQQVRNLLRAGEVACTQGYFD